MQIDKITYNDLSVFSNEETFSIFHKIDFTRTNGGKDWLRHLMREPFDSIQKIKDTQDIIRLLASRLEEWPSGITNGTLIMIERFYDTPLDPIPHSTDFISSRLYKILHSADYGLVRFSVKHFRDFFSGMQQIAALIGSPGAPARLQSFAGRIRTLLQHRQLQELLNKKAGERFSVRENLYYGHFLSGSFKMHFSELTDMFYQLDAWYAMSRAVKQYGLTFPEFVASDEPLVKADQLYHILLADPISYDIELSPRSNFLFLTGANMAGKSTFIKSLGVAVYLAHLGMGVPAAKLTLSLFDGILSNINVEDNIVKGESFFFNEVQRIKKTILTISDGKKWLVLIDELFKGTNIQDAMRCSLTVIKGLIRIKGSLFILSTHLYEIGEEMKQYQGISFKYFETAILNDKLVFSYQLREGISNDRFGYFILQTEKVVELLDQL
ncbi:MAG TPA: DNA mismatch repair protein MutS [Agriterribacter sp.]|nr:DNA mismatch repair protein MutS [Agriterribacter sp.]